MIALQKLRKMFFISSKKLFLFSRCSNFCKFIPSYPHFPDTKGQIEAEYLRKMFFISSKKLFLFSRCSNFCKFIPSYPHFLDTKGQIKAE